MGPVKKGVHIFIFLVVIPNFYACTLKIERGPKDVTVPEAVYRGFTNENDARSNVAVFRFDEPDLLPPVDYVYPVDIGYHAAHRLYQQLLQKGAFRKLIQEYAHGNATLGEKIEIAREKGCDLVVTGRVLYYFEGGPLSESRVDEEITVIDVRTEEILWYAEATEIGKPVKHADYFVLIRESEPAPPASALLVLNARKFANMLAGSGLSAP
jgi:hypothetical protein